MADRYLFMTHRSPFVRKVRVALHEKGLEYENILVDLQNKSHQLRSTGPIQKVPVLQDNGLNIVDSTVILEYLEDRYPAIRLLPYGYLQRADARMWNQASDELAEAAIQIFMGRKKRTPDLPELEKAERMMHRILDYADKVLGNRSYFVGKQFTVADIGMVSALGYIEFRLGRGWRERRHVLTHYFDRLSQLEGFATTQPRE